MRAKGGRRAAVVLEDARSLLQTLQTLRMSTGPEPDPPASLAQADVRRECSPAATASMSVRSLIVC